MFVFIALALIGAAAAQGGGRPGGEGGEGGEGGFNFREHVIDDIHGYRVWYDDEHNIFVFANNLHCYVVEANTERWDDVVATEAALHKFTETVFTQIDHSTGVTPLTQAEAIAAYHSRLEVWECFDKDILKVSFTAPTASGALVG